MVNRTEGTRPAQMPVGARRDPWVALEAGADPWRAARDLRRAHEAFVGGGAPPARLRRAIAASWQRCLVAGAPPEGGGAPTALAQTGLDERRRSHPLGRTLEAVRRVLHAAMAESQHIMVVSDADGVLLWVEGPAREISRAADDMNFVPGSDWSESGVGTNSIGTALATDHAVQVFSAEHFNRACHRWTCSGAPVHDPVSGDVIGAIDITSNLASYHPSGHSLVLAAAEVAEGVLAKEVARRDQTLVAHYLERLDAAFRPPSAIASRDGRILASYPNGWIGLRVPRLPGGGGALPHDGVEAEPVLDGAGYVLRPLHSRSAGAAPAAEPPPRADTRLLVRRLGHDRVRCVLHAREVDLSRRHGEIVLLLARRPEGVTCREIVDEVYGGAAAPATVRAEMFRLREVLGTVLASRPYRLTVPVELEAGTQP